VRWPFGVLRLCLLLPHLQPFSNMTGQEPKKEAPQLRLLWDDQLDACLLAVCTPSTHLEVAFNSAHSFSKHHFVEVTDTLHASSYVPI
jgi:hypothetical protein